MKKENQLLARLGKLIGVEPRAEAASEVKQDKLAVDVNLAATPEVFTALQTEFETFKAEANALLEQADADKKELLATLAEANSSLTAVQEMLAKAEEAKAAAEKLVHETKMAARKALVVATIGDAKADAFLTATEALDDAAFTAVSSALAGSVAAEANTTLFKEVGVEAKADATTFSSVESEEMKILKQKYSAAQPAN